MQTAIIICKRVNEQIWLSHCIYKSHNQHVIWVYRPNIFAQMCYNTTNCNTYFSCYCQICARNKYAHQIRHICQMFYRLIWKMYTHICATYDVTTFNHVTMGTVHVFDIYHWTNVVGTLHIYMFHCTATVVHLQTLHYYTWLKHLVSDTNSYKVMRINVKKINMAAKCYV